MKKIIKDNKLLLIVLAGYVTYIIMYILSSSYIIDGIRYFSLFDDAMISMRYAKHLAQGYGLAWNIGEPPVEGFTNQVWVLVLAAFHLVCHDKTFISFWVQLLGMLLLSVNLVFIYKISMILKPELKSVALGAVILTGFYLPLNFWSVMGLEVSALTLLTTISVWLTLRNLKSGTYSVMQLLIPLSGILLRPDAALIYIVFLIFIWKTYPAERRKTLIIGISFLVIVMAGLTLFRWFYFGDLLPNTYYLKMTGYPMLMRLGRGLFVVLKFIIFILIVMIFPFGYYFKNRNKENTLLMSLVMIQILYTIYIGGDAWEFWGGANRFVSIVMPLLFIFTSISLLEFKDRILVRYPIIRKSPKLAFAGIIFLCLIVCNSFRGQKSLGEWALITKPFTIEENVNCTRIALAIDPVLGDSGSVMVNTAGVIPYFLERKTIDMLGKNDRYIARLPMRVSEGFSSYYDFSPGHLKWDYNYSIGQQKPDIVIHLWKENEKAFPILEKYYLKKKLKNYEFWFLKGSKNIKWAKIF